jgi:hypothetical protein
LAVWLISIGAALAGCAAGVGVLALLARAGYGPRGGSARPAGASAGGTGPALEAEVSADPAAGNDACEAIARALREPLARLRRSEGAPAEVVEALERLAWQCRMLAATPRPMKALPASPVDLLQRAAEDVALLRLGKVASSWTLRTRQPVWVDVERARGGFRELLAASAEAAGEGGRLAIRVLPAADSRHPVCVEIEVGRAGCVLDDLALRVARRLLEGQGARLESAGERMRVFLRSLPPGDAAQIPSNM